MSDSSKNLDLFTASSAFPEVADKSVGQSGHTTRSNIPLAELLRPKQLTEVVGQVHLIGPGKPLSLIQESGKLYSIIFWGPPGVGKTTLAILLAQSVAADCIYLSAVLSGVKEIREAIQRAEYNQQRGRETVVFIDEIHRFNKAQQDAFLPYVEKGTFTFIGATTENPSFEINNALLSRATVYTLDPLADEDLRILLARALSAILPEIQLTKMAQDTIIRYADGDGRRLLNLLEQLTVPIQKTGLGVLDQSLIESFLVKSLRRFDKGGEAFYDQISALHKSVRGSDPNAALYWFCRMLDGGCDPRYVARRLIRMAVEDIGLADPTALTLANQAAETYERLGSPEGELALAECAIYLAVAPKSNAVYTAYKATRAHIAQDASRPVPLRFRNAPTQLMKNLGYGADYRYAHDEPEGFVAGEHYFPDGMEPVSWYQPTDRGFEQKIRQRLASLAALAAHEMQKPSEK